TLVTRAMGAAVEVAVGFDAVTDDPHPAVGAGLGQQVDRALEAVERVLVPLGGANRECLVIIIPADVATCHVVVLSLLVSHSGMGLSACYAATDPASSGGTSRSSSSSASPVLAPQTTCAAIISAAR